MVQYQAFQRRGTRLTVRSEGGAPHVLPVKPATPGPAAALEEGSCRALRRAPNDTGGAGTACAVTIQATAGAAAAEEPLAAVDYRGLRRSLRQALLATSGKTHSPASAAGCVPAGADGHGGGNTTAGAPPTAAGSAAGGGVLGAPNAGGGRRRMRQPQRQLLQSYVVGQQHQQVGPQQEGQEGTPCLAEWLGIESSVPCCCCGNGCASCSSAWNGKSGAAAGSSASSSQATPGYATRAGGGGGVRSVLDVYAGATAKRQKHQQQQQPRLNAAVHQEEAGDRGEGIVFGPSWFDDPMDTDKTVDVCLMRPASPSRCAAFFSQQEKWEAEDRADSAEAAAATAGTPWPKGSTSCSFGGYGAATRNGGVVPLCCYCGLPLRPPAVGSLRGAGAESGCPLAAAAAAVAALGLEGWTQWCRCCTRVYGDLRLQHQRDASWLPFASFVVPKAPLRYVLLPADGAKDTPGGPSSVAAALAAAAVAAEPRRNRAADDGAGGGASAAVVEGDTESAGAAPAGSLTGNATSSLRRTRSGQHFTRAPPQRSSGRNSNNTIDIVRFLGASCCWPSSISGGSFVQPLARLQQQLTQLQQQQQAEQPLSQQHEVRGSLEGVCSASGAPSVPDVGVKSPPAAVPDVGGLAAPAATETPPAAAGVPPAATSPAAETEPAAAASSEAAVVPGAAGSANLPSVAVDKPEGTPVPAELSVAAAEAPSPSTSLTPEDTKKQPDLVTPQPQRPRTATGKNQSPPVATRTVVVPRVYLESSTSCYVATAFDAVRNQLLQKRFCCSILGEQRAHALACQWLRWVHRHCSASLHKPEHKAEPHRAQPYGAGAVQPTIMPAASVTPSQISDCAVSGAVAASPGRKLTGGGPSVGRRASQRIGAPMQTQQQESLRGDRPCRRRKRYGEGADVSDAEGAPFHTPQCLGDSCTQQTQVA